MIAASIVLYIGLGIIIADHEVEPTGRRHTLAVMLSHKELTS
jgi:hypothetical protein